jgi:cobalt-zinc-cadmium efflux system outer membrane protein
MAVQRALDANPRIVAARLRRSVNIASRDVAAERLNPEFRVEMAKETPKEGYTVAVPLELGGRRARRIEVADAAIKAGDAELNQVIAEVQSEVRRAFVSRIVAETRQALLDEMQMLAQRARDAAQARFDAGGVPRLEVLQAQLAFADAQNQATAAQGTRDAARASLNAALGLSLDAPTPIDTMLDVGSALLADALVARARQSSAELIALDRRIEEQRARIALAHSLRTPDVTPEATLTRRAAPEFDTGWRAAIAVSIPVFTTHRAGVAVEEATLAQLTGEREAAATRISGEVASAAAIAESQRQQYVRYRDQIVPQALEVERMAEDSYRLGQTPIAAYLQALQSTRDIRLRAIQAAADLQNALADLDRAAGATLTTLP